MKSITITGDYITLGYFLATCILYTYLWVMGLRNAGNKSKWYKKFQEVKAVQLEREKIINEMLNYKRETGYSFKKEHVEKHNELATNEVKKIKELEKLV